MVEPMPETKSVVSYRPLGSGKAASARECKTLRNATLVQHFPLFANISPADCREIVSAARECEFSRRDTIFLQGDPIRQVILLTSGSAKIMQLGQNGAEVILRLAGPGDVVEIAGRPAERHHSSMVALSACTALIWEARAFQALVERFPGLWGNILKATTQCLQELEERYREISTEKVATRLGLQLLRLFNQVGRRVNGHGTLKVNLSREELAQLTGTTFFTVSRLLCAWSERGLLTAGREWVSVHSIRALREFAENGMNDSEATTLPGFSCLQEDGHDSELQHVYED